MLKELLVNIPLVEALDQMLGYTKFMKDLITKKSIVIIELADNLHHCSAIATRSLDKKKKDLGAFTIPSTIGAYDFARTLRDLEIALV